MNRQMPFFVAKLEKVFLSKNKIEIFLDEKNFIYDLKLDRNGVSTLPWIKLLTKGKNPGAKFLKNKKGSIASKKYPIRWLGAGVLPVLIDKNKKRYLLLNKRGKFGTWPNYYDTFAGFSSSVSDMLYPSKLINRELNEELTIYENKTKINLKKSTELKISNSTTVIINYKNKKYITKNMILIIDEKTGTIDLRKIVLINVKNIKNLVINNSEERFSSPKTRVIEKRQIKIVPFENLFKGLMTPSLRACIKNLT